MVPDLQSRIEQQLPKREMYSAGSLFNAVAAVASIIGLLTAPFVVTDASITHRIIFGSISLLCITLLIYIFIWHRKKLHRYAQSTYFVHFVNHAIRDSIQADGISAESIESTTERLLGAIASCFSILTGVRCRACIAEIDSKFNIKVIARDGVSGINKKPPTDHPLDKNTDFCDLWFAKNGHSRYFLSHDLPKLWSQNKYQNSSFDAYGLPELGAFLRFHWVKSWRLPYKSALILPLRYISTFTPPKAMGHNHSHWRYWGFLCIDANKTNVFDDRYTPELGGAFADALYTFYSQMDIRLEKATQPIFKE